MSNKKWYWAYQPSVCELVETDEISTITGKKVCKQIYPTPCTYLFETLDQARDHAVGQGVFDEITGKEAMMAFDEALFFEISADELEEVKPYQIIEDKL